MIPPIDLQILPRLADPNLADLYLQHQECRASSAYADVVVTCAFYDQNPGTLAKAKELDAECSRLEVEALHRFNNECAISAPPEQPWDAFCDLAHDKAALENACAAMSDAATAAREAGIKNDLPAVRYWRAEIDRRKARFDSLRRTFYQRRVLSCPPRSELSEQP